MIFFVFFCSSCITKTSNVIDDNEEYTINTFQINDKFEVVNFERNNDNIILIIKSDKDIEEYLLNLNDKFDNLNFNIYVFDTKYTYANFDIEHLEHFRELISYNSSTFDYTSYRYILLPNIEKADKLIEFTNEKVEKKENAVEIYIRMNLEKKSIVDLVAQLKLYKYFVTAYNENLENIKLILNDTYIYENDEYIIEKTICKINEE